MKILLLVWCFLITTFFVFPNIAGVLSPIIDFLDQTDSVIYKTVQSSIRRESSPNYTSEFCKALGYEFILKESDTGICAAISEDQGRICYSGFQCSTGVCIDDSNSPYYIGFGPGSCSKFYENDKPQKNIVLFGIRSKQYPRETAF